MSEALDTNNERRLTYQVSHEFWSELETLVRAKKPASPKVTKNELIKKGLEILASIKDDKKVADDFLDRAKKRVGKKTKHISVSIDVDTNASIRDVYAIFLGVNSEAYFVVLLMAIALL